MYGLQGISPVSEAYWQAKIWGLLHDPVLKALHNNTGRGSNSFWQQLEVMQNWVNNGWNPEQSQGKILEHIKLADYISSASDRGAIGSVTQSINYAPSNDRNKGLEIKHLLSGEKRDFKIKQHSELLANRKEYLDAKEQKLLEAIPSAIKQCPKLMFWWLWRCLPEVACQEFNDESLMLMPAETRLPDSSIWSHASITAALAGALAGYDLTEAEIKHWPANKALPHPYLASFTFSPVQELIKASRKMRDFWAGSWLLHYLSAKVCWQLALQYGPDSLLYPSLYQQPLIDRWLLLETVEKAPEFAQWIDKPAADSLLTAGFPNVLVLVLPKDKVQAAMQTAKQTLLKEWQQISHLVLTELKNHRRWMPDLQADSRTWKDWLQSQWQFYWTALPIGKEGEPLKNAAIPLDREAEFTPWLDAQNQAYNLLNNHPQKLFLDKEIDFLRDAYQQRWERQGRKFSVNVGSWWAHIFDANRYGLAAVKNARNWQIPTAFGPRSTVSGIGPVVHPGQDWITEGETKKLWEKHAGLFDGREQLNATETVKRGLHKILPNLLQLSEEQIAASYPDLTSGVAGYLKNSDRQQLNKFNDACRAVKNLLIKEKNTVPDVITEKWGIPWIDENEDAKLAQFHPRFLNSGWLIEDLNIPEEERNNYRNLIETTLSQYYPNNNPANWYVLAAGDGDDMSKWLKGEKLQNYRDYIPSGLSVSQDSLKNFLEVKKRMGPSTHNALSRALLDFSNQLVPYLTEQRYAGRLIYGGGDDVLAYTNLWEWDKWLWDIRQCFRGDRDPRGEFNNEGDYWQYNSPAKSSSLTEIRIAKRPLFTMGRVATISFGIVIAHHSVPLAIALENLWEAEKKAKEHKSPEGSQKDAVQVRVLYGNGNILKATTKFQVFHQWQKLTLKPFSQEYKRLDAAIFEQAASLWSQHPAPLKEAIAPWTKAFCDRRDQFLGDEVAKNQFQQNLAEFLGALWETTSEIDRDSEVQHWLKLTAFTLRNRDI
ncbi:type III-B CRISPR-associated protein Cas10/Cmr2 [Chlorogloeopsis fritschii PCC 9212]|uniref:Uncharacterized protein n=1 Tax=Chlorogloeopsis fritschii PCC 6912 TaxID=211165 RepID=A0A3S0ZYY1_CHLFR|nr:type III-B CRISPR-associated protein Cas10/Cmr2 [Chlorogloeopsis fritschii]RUR83491.1 hypothetical protein PCC6912_23240 [Chlorogloeopsis fritschii PCC 6912]